ncbi:ATP-dependent Clp protease ATP-binding subunit [Rhodotorula paludigena]|uniref:ATP-dependent Clp protease ATP-binding subunit n=1 Tax=Rhodotorula paludigena TaxID=86838 RepID=UPI003175485D
MLAPRRFLASTATFALPRSRRSLAALPLHAHAHARLVSTTPVSRAPPRGGPPPPPGGGGGGFPMGNIFSGGQGKREPGKTLEENSVDLTALAREGKLDPVIGRADETKRMVEILSRRTKNNPLLIGPAGVGKTAVVEGLAQKIVAGDVPESLKNRRLLSIDLATLMSGTGVRGSFEEKMSGLIKDLEEADDVIAFIDEIHQILNLGKAEGSLDAGNLLKPALARGLQVAGATTLDEFRTSLEKDKALLRRFQTLLVDEPSVEQAVTMLRGLKPKLEVHHGVSISDQALVSAAVMSNRFISDRHLPDKAIDLVDEAAASLRLRKESPPEELDALRREITTLQIELSSLGKDTDAVSASRRGEIEGELRELEAKAGEMERAWRAERDRAEEIRRTREELERRRFELDEAQRRGDYQRASELRYSVLPELEKKLPKDGEDGAGDEGARVTSDDIARVVAKATGIPTSTLLRGDRSRLLDLDAVLRSRVKGQEQAISAVASAIRLSRAGLHAGNRPIASFLFLGQTGTGKTELAKALSQELTGTEKNLITINMSEYQDKHTVSRLIGAPPGYVGFEDAGQLTEAVRRKPYSVVLFDELEKAHKDVSTILLQLLDEGKLTDSQGRVIDFKNTTIICTSNMGSDILAENGSTLPDGTVTDKAKQEVIARVQSQYPPELLNRLDEMIVFNSLSPSTIADIVDLRLAEVQQTLNHSPTAPDRRISLLVEQGARDWLATHGYHPQYGARAVLRLINREVRKPLAEAILRGELGNGDTARVRLNAAGTGLEVLRVRQEGQSGEEGEEELQPSKEAA